MQVILLQQMPKENEKGFAQNLFCKRGCSSQLQQHNLAISCFSETEPRQT